MKNIFNSIKHNLKSDTNKLLLEEKISDESFYYFNNILDLLDCPFVNLGTQYKRIKYFTELGTYIPPLEHVIGERLNENRKNNSYSLVPINCTEQFIPLRHVLKNFFQLKDVLTDTLQYINKCEIQNPFFY